MYTLAEAFAAIATAHPDRECLVIAGGTRPWGEVYRRAAGFAGLLGHHSLGCDTQRRQLANWERGQSVIGLMLFNGPEYLEAMLGAYAARCAPANITWRATADELAYLLDDCAAEALVYDAAVAGIVQGAIERCDTAPALLIEVNGDTRPAVAGALAYEAALGRAKPAWLDGSPDDLYLLYTGGTTGNPKGTLWRQADFIAGALGVRHTELDRLLAAAGDGERLRTLPAPPLIHGAAQWSAWSTWLSGGTVVIQEVVDRFDADDVLTCVERHRVSSLQIVGDAFGRPLLDALARHRYDLRSLRFITSGGTALTADVRAGLHRALPGVTILDILGSSESGRLAVATHRRAAPAGFVPSGSAVVLDSDRGRVLAGDDDQVGWLATSGPIPLGYLGDRSRTEATFPVIDGVRYAVPGDRARWGPDGTIDVLGRDAAVINTGGEKVFAEEVEAQLKTHPCVDDALVVGRPHIVLGSEVCAVVAVRPGTTLDLDQARAHLAVHLARYKLPRALVVAERIQRSPAGKPDYAWARAQLVGPSKET